MLHDQTDGNAFSTQTIPTNVDFLGLPNLLPNTGNYRTHRRSRSGIETRHPPDLTQDVDLLASQQVNIWNIILFIIGHALRKRSSV